MVAHGQMGRNRVSTEVGDVVAVTQAVIPQVYARSCRSPLRGHCRRGGTCRLPAVRQCQPLCQALSSFVRRGSENGIIAVGKTGRAAQLCAPSVTDGRHFDVVRAPANGFVEAMNCHVCQFPGNEAE